jgi:hypothetical protein
MRKVIDFKYSPMTLSIYAIRIVVIQYYEQVWLVMLYMTFSAAL